MYTSGIVPRKETFMKFKVGDKVKLIKKSGAIVSGAEIGCELTILEVGNYISGLNYLVSYIDDFEKLVSNGKVSDCHIELIEPKLTKNQRITALEKEVDELKVIVHQLREANITIDDVKQHLNIEATPSIVEGKHNIKGVAIGLDKPKTPNQLRAEIVEKAKGFVENAIIRGIDRNARNGNVGNETYKSSFYVVDFVVKNNRVTALVTIANYKGEKVGSTPKHVGRSKCNPTDVFNEHIGKAIALGRALGLDVSEFEQAVQPTGIVVGMEIEGLYNDLYNVTYVKDNEIGTDNGRAGFFYKHRFEKGQLKILNDTNAIYGGGE